MPDRYHLHGAQRRKCSTALLLIDVINDMEFPDGGEQLLRQTLPVARKIAALKKRAVAAELPRPTNFLAPNSEPDQPSYTLSLPSWFSISAYPAWNGPEQRSIAALIRQKVSYLKPST